MDWKSLGSALFFPIQMVYFLLKAAVCLLIPSRLRDMSGDVVLITGGGRGIGRHLAREFAKQGAKKVDLLVYPPPFPPMMPCSVCEWVAAGVGGGGGALAPCSSFTELSSTVGQPVNPNDVITSVYFFHKGSAATKAAANHRLQLILWGRTEKCLKETCEEIKLMGTECHYFLCDVGNREEVYQQAKVVRERVGDVTILVNNAAVVHGKSLMDSDDDALLKSQHINTLGQFWTTKAFLPRMLELQNGHVVCINSVLSQSSIPGAIDYCTSKASSFAFMESLTLGLLDCPGVCTTTVLPFHTNTEMFQGMRVRFPNLFPPLKPETVARRTVEAVQTNTALLYLPWTMHALVILKSFMPQQALEEIHKFSGSYTCMNTFKGRT
ncbi:DHRS3 reductase, partial [Polyodon spathula]|nr:DHRS3 reductase [Polyodon spathula]